MKKINIHELTQIALMAALVFITTAIGIRIPIGGSDTILHFGNTFTLLSGLFLGPLGGGLAAGIGAGLFDLLGGYSADSLMSFTNKFLIAYITGCIFRSDFRFIRHYKLILSVLIGNIFYIILYFFKNMFVLHFIQGISFSGIWVYLGLKTFITIVNAVLAFSMSLVLYHILSRIYKNIKGIN